jgi:DNA-binding IclR family transcriptional regulator
MSSKIGNGWHLHPKASRLTPNTLVTKTALGRVRKPRYAIDGRENDAEVHAGDGRVFATLSISNPLFGVDRNRAKSRAPALKTAGTEIAESVPRGGRK